MSDFTGVVNSLLADQVYLKLKDAILKKSLPPGQKLDIFELAEKFNVSRTPIKEAFNRLQHDGLVDIKPRIGTFVAKVSKGDIIELLEARLLIECWGAQEGMPKATQDDINRMHDIVQKMDQCYSKKQFDFLKYNLLDIQFHESIVSLGNNRRILQMYHELNSHWMVAREYYEIAFEKARKGYLEHGQMVQAYQTGDIAQLLKLLKRHIQDVIDDLLYSSTI